MPDFVAADGVALHYDVLGDGGPLVTLAGGAARHPRYLRDLAGMSGLVVPHLRGVGRSPMPADPQDASFWRQARDVESLREHLGQDKLTIIGHSAGTRLAISYAVQYPARVGALVLITPPSAYLVDVASDAAALIDERRGDPVFDAAVAALAAGPDMSTEDAFNTWQLSTSPVGYARWTGAEREHSVEGRWYLPAVRAYFSVDPPADLAARLAGVTAPTLVVAGARDCLTGLKPVTALAERFPNGVVRVIDDCGHYPWIEQPAGFRRAVERFLSAVRP